ncbi:unnamed protein product [Chrysoparadoxa australica]
MLEDPDTLMVHPEVVKVIEANTSTGADDDEGDWETKGAELPTPPQPATTASAKEEDETQKEKPQKAAAAPAPAPPEPEVVAEEDVEDEDPREHLNLVFIGHVDAGKSTLSGNILYLTDFVDKRTIERYEREAKQRNRESWFLAFIMDTNEEERAKGKTVEVGRAQFETDIKRYTILDAPGHNAYVPNMIQGAAQADVGILVISARRGEFETGFEKGGQTREHALLARTLGVSHLVVVINKMDDHTVSWSKERFDECVTKLKPFLRGCGFAVKREVKFIPISGLTGANIKKEVFLLQVMLHWGALNIAVLKMAPLDIQVSSSDCSWWSALYTAGENNTSESTLIGLLDELHMGDRDSKGPLRCPVLDRYSDRGTIALAKVEQGTLREQMAVTLMPTRMEVKVEAIWINQKRVMTAKPGENVTMKLSCAENDVQKGFVVCDPVTPCRASDTLLCQIALVELTEQRPIFSSGYESVFHCHTCEEECQVLELVSITDKKTQKVTKRPRFAKEGSLITAKIKTGRSVSIEKFEDMQMLGRFTLRTEGKTIAIGRVLEIKKMKK